MVIIEDTRNQIGKHRELNAYLTGEGHTVIRSKMLVGDYQIASDGRIAVDTKQDVMELIENIVHSHERFRRECQTAQMAGITLYVLIEEELPGGRLDNWVSPVWHSDGRGHCRGDKMTKTDPATLRKALITMQKKYGVRFRFCSKDKTGETLLKLLEGGRKNEA